MDSAESKPPSASAISGKLVIVGIVTVAVCAAAISWYFRYNATHRVAKFWGPEAVALIRDAPQVTLRVMPFEAVGDLANSPDAAEASSVTDFDVSQAGGLTHLRNALLEDFNFVWPGLNDWQPINADDFHDWKWILEFRDPKNGKYAAMQFTQDCTLAARVMSSKERGSDKLTAIPTNRAMAKGLREMFAEFSGVSSADAVAKPQAAKEPADAKR